MRRGFILLITGLPDSGKAALARELEERLLERGLNAETLDTEEIRAKWLSSLGNSKDEVNGYLGLIGHFCTLLARNGVIGITTAASPCREAIERQCNESGSLIEVHLKCPDFSHSHVGPHTPEVLLETESAPPESLCPKVLRTLEMLGYIPELKCHDYDEEDEAKITQRLKDLGYL
jgi:hypothetical protein